MFVIFEISARRTCFIANEIIKFIIRYEGK